jgi:hypothetical protein
MNKEIKKAISVFEKKWSVRFTLKHTGKMLNVLSLSTCCLFNKICEKRRRNKKSICAHCFSAKMNLRYKLLRSKLKKNTEVLTSVLIPVNEWPVFNTEIFRLESFGDVANVIQCRNYFNFCKANPNTQFTVWTKNPWFYKSAIAIDGKPKNLIIIYSSPCLNVVTQNILERYPFIDKVFTVFDKDFATANNIVINCGARSCDTCRRCYTKTDSLEYVNELKK